MHHFSQLSARFELDGLTSPLGLEGILVDRLVSETGIGEGASQMLLRFAHEDISEVRDSRSPMQKKDDIRAGVYFVQLNVTMKPCIREYKKIQYKNMNINDELPCYKPLSLATCDSCASGGSTY